MKTTRPLTLFWLTTPAFWVTITITLLALACIMARGATVTVNEAQLTGTAKNRAITINTRTGRPVGYGTNLFSGPLLIQPTNGVATITLPVPGVYTFQLDGVNKTFFMSIPESTNTYNALDLINQGMDLDAPFPAFAAGNNTTLTTNWIAGYPIITFGSIAVAPGNSLMWEDGGFARGALMFDP